MAFDIAAILQAFMGGGEANLYKNTAAPSTPAQTRAWAEYRAGEHGGTGAPSTYATSMSPEATTSGAGGWQTFQGLDPEEEKRRLALGGGMSPEGTPPIPSITDIGALRDVLNLPEGFLTPEQRRKLMAVGVSPVNASRAVLDAIVSGSGQYAPYTPAQIQMASTMRALMAIVSAQQPQRQGVA